MNPQPRPSRRAPRKLRLSELAVPEGAAESDPLCAMGHQAAGLALRVQPTGGKSYYCVYSRHGRPRWYRIGNAGAIGLSDARTMAAEVMLAVARGSDPAAERRAERSAGTFGELATAYVEQYAKKHNKSWKQAARLVERYATERWSKLPAASITRSDVKDLLAKLKPILANQVLAAISAVFSWGVREEHVTENPCRGIKRNETQSRERILAESEIPTFWKALDGAADPITSTALKLVLLTGQRPGEVCAMQVEHLKDGQWWELPGKPSDGWPGTKNGKGHRVALSAPVRALIAEMIDDDKGFVFQHQPGVPLQRLDQRMRDIVSKLAIEPVTPHDLRRTFASTVASLGFGRQAIDRLLNHADNSIASVYDRHAMRRKTSK